MATKRHIIPGTIFDTDLTGFYQPEQGVTILGKTLRYRAPNIPINGLVYTFLVAVTKDLIATPEEQLRITADEMYERVFAYLKEMQTASDDNEVNTKRQITMGKMFLNPEANKLLLEAIRLSFPDLDQPEALTDSAFVELAGFIFKQMPEG